STALATGLYGGATNDRCGRSRPMSQRTIPVEAQNMPANTTLIDTASTHGLPSTTAHRNSSQIRLSYLKETRRAQDEPLLRLFRPKTIENSTDARFSNQSTR